MLGAARASQYAGWWSGDPKFNSLSLVTNTSIAQIGNAVSLPENDWTSPDLGNNLDMTFDNTSVGSNQSVLFAVTFKVGTIADFTWSEPTSGFYSIRTFDSDFASWIPWRGNFGNANGDDVRAGPAVGRRSTDNRFGIIWEWGSFSAIYSNTLTWDADIADTWITVVVSHAPDSSSFANWTGGSTSSGFDAVRVVICNASTGAMLDKIDQNVSIINPIVANPSAVTWRPYWALDLVAGDFNTQTYAGEVRNDIFLASGWVSIGDIVDPMGTDGTTGYPYYQYLCGQGLPETVGGSRAWSNMLPVSVTADTGPSYNGSTDYQRLDYLGPCRLTQDDGSYAFMPQSFVAAPYTDADIP